MDPLNPNSPRQNNKQKKKGQPKKAPLLRNILTSVGIFLLLIIIYSAIVENANQLKTVPISQLATDISAGKVTKIDVKGDILEVTYANNDKRQTQKEADAALTQSLANYGVSKEKLAAVQINIVGENGLMFWILNLAPFVIPLLFIALFII